ncbi:MAG TPA: translation elongation factor Ts, partial [Acholeplasmataceae bacterium]|nr:translation elongation factor Ts [Acholeplasmataceae bacterium]
FKNLSGDIVTHRIVEVVRDDAGNTAYRTKGDNPRNSVDPEFLAKETEILRQETLNEGKPAQIVDKIVVGKLNKSLKSICLVDQEFVKNPDMTVGDYVKSNNAKIITFIRLAVGEGIEKRVDNFAAEVMAAAGK